MFFSVCLLFGVFVYLPVSLVCFSLFLCLVGYLLVSVCLFACLLVLLLPSAPHFYLETWLLSFHFPVLFCAEDLIVQPYASRIATHGETRLVFHIFYTSFVFIRSYGWADGRTKRRSHLVAVVGCWCCNCFLHLPFETTGSLIFIDGEFTHAVHKTPPRNDFKVQGGKIVPVDVTKGAVELLMRGWGRGWDSCC